MHKPIPPMWGEDSITSFLDGARENQFATFHNKKSQFNRLVSIDGALIKLLQDAKNPKPWFPATIMLRAIGTFKAACSLAAAGQVYEIGAMTRSLIETAAYAVYMAGNDSRAEIWLRRNDSPKHKEAARREFTYNKVLKALESLDRDAAAVFKLLYEDAIELGAHPNEKGVFRSMKLQHESGSRTFQAVLLHEDHLNIDDALRRIEAAGLFALICCRLIWPVRCDLSGITQLLYRLRAGSSIARV